MTTAAHGTETGRAEALAPALLALMSSRPYDEISVTELCRKAGISRNGFYRRCSGLDEILKGAIRGFYADRIEPLGLPAPGAAGAAWYTAFFTRMRDAAEPLRLYSEAGFQSFYQKTANESLLAGCAAQDPLRRGRLLAWNGALQNITWDWLLSGMTAQPAAMAEFCLRVLPPL